MKRVPNNRSSAGRRTSTKPLKVKTANDELPPLKLPPALSELKIPLGGPESFSDQELIELILALAVPRENVKTVAFALLLRFGSFGKAVCAPTEELKRIKELGDDGVVVLRLLSETMFRTLRGEVKNRPVMRNLHSLMRYLIARYAREMREKFLCFFLDTRNQVIAEETMAEGTINELHIYPREIIKRALELNATAIILVHNHPSEAPQPSPRDVEITWLIKEIGEPLGIALHDHIIVAGTEWYSFLEDGRLKRSIE